jgi:hypothetical protein
VTHLCAHRRTDGRSAFALFLVHKTDVRPRCVPVPWYKSRVLQSQDPVSVGRERLESSSVLFCHRLRYNPRNFTTCTTDLFPDILASLQLKVDRLTT